MKHINKIPNSSVSSIIILLFTVFCLTGCEFNHNGRGNLQPKLISLDAQQEQNAKIQTAILTDKLLQLTITIPAQFKAMTKLLDRTYAPIDGIAAEVYVDRGNVIKKGQALVKIKSDVIGQIQLEFLNEYINAESQIKQMSAQYNLSKLTYKRERLLYSEGISSRAQYEVAQAQMLKDGANLSSLKIQRRAIIQVYGQRIALYGGSKGAIRKAISTKSIYPYITLYSNKNGIVLDRKVNPGETVSQNKELFDIADLSTIWLVGYAFEQDAPHLKIGQKVLGVFEKGSMEDVKGQLSFVASMLDPDKKTLEVIADVPNYNLAIKPNMYAEMVVDLQQVKVLSVPNSAVQKYGDYNFVYVEVKPHLYEERKVQLGQHNDNYSEVKSGLKLGEKVVSRGGFSLLGESIKRSEEKN